MVLKTKRLILRNWNINDAEDLYTYARDSDVGLPAGWKQHENIGEKNIINTIFIPNPEAYAICLKSNNKAIGSIALKEHNTIIITNDSECGMINMELGYWICKPFWGQGLIPEAINEVLRHAFEDIGISKVWCVCSEENIRSQRIQKKCGFKYYYTMDNIQVPALNEIRKCYVNYITQENWNGK